MIEHVLGRIVEVELPASSREPAAVFRTKLGEHASGSLRTRDAATADTRRLAVLAHLSKLYEAARNGAVVLSHRQVVGLAGEVYRRLRQENHENPGTPRAWAAWKSSTRAALEGRLEPGNAPVMMLQPRTEEEAAVLENFGRGDLTASVDNVPAGTYDDTALRERCGRLALWVLQEHGIEVDPRSHLALLREVARAALQAGWQIKREAQGFYWPDPNADRFPAFETKTQTGITFTELFERWKAETKAASSTIQTWGGVIRQFVGHGDVARVRSQDVIAWKDALVAQGRRAPTVSDGHVSALKTLLAYAKRNRLVPENVAIGVRVQDRRQAGESMLGYADAEVARLLAIAAQKPSRRSGDCPGWPSK